MKHQSLRIRGYFVHENGPPPGTVPVAGPYRPNSEDPQLFNVINDFRRVNMEPILVQERARKDRGDFEGVSVYRRGVSNAKTSEKAEAGSEKATEAAAATATAADTGEAAETRPAEGADIEAEVSRSEPDTGGGNHEPKRRRGRRMHRHNLQRSGS